MDNCPACGSPLVRAYGKLKSDIGSEEVYNEQTMVCMNGEYDAVKKQFKCSNYCGPDLSNPLKIVELRRTKEN
jgi:hypothetical protein